MATSVVDQSAYLGKPKNVNVGRCIKEFGQPVMLIGVKPGTIIDGTALADVKAFFTGLAVNNNAYNRCYRLGRITGWEEANGDSKSESLPNGLTKYIADGKPTYTIRFDGKGFDYHRILRSFKNAQRFLEWFIVHETGEIGGVVVVNADGSYHMKGIKFFQLFTPARKFATSSNSEAPMLMATLDNVRQTNEDYAYIDLDFDIEEATAGVVDVHLEATNSTSTKWNVKCLAGYTKQDMSAMFPTELAATTAFVVKNLTAGTTLTVSGVSAKTGYFEVTLSAAPTTGDKLTIQLASVSVLSGLGVAYYESDIIQVTQP